MRCHLRRQQALILPIEIHAIEVLVIQVFVLLLARRHEINHVILLIHILQIRHRSIAMRDLILQRSGRQVIQINLRPVAPLTHPKKFIRIPQHLPVRLALPSVVRVHMLVIHIAHRTRRRVRDPHILILVIPRRRHKRQVRIVLRELHIIPSPIAIAANVIAPHAAMLQRLRLQPHHRRGRHVNHHRLNHRDIFIPHQRIPPRLQHRMPIRHRHQIHQPRLPLVLLERRNLLPIRRPRQNRCIRVLPSRVIRRIPKVLHAIRRQLFLFFRRHRANPKIVVANKRRHRFIRRQVLRPRMTPRHRSRLFHHLHARLLRSRLLRRRLRIFRALRHLRIAMEHTRASRHREPAIRLRLIVRHAQLPSLNRLRRQRRQRRCQLRVIERRSH